MKYIIPKILAATILLCCTITAYGACFNGWFLPEPLKKPVSLREGSTKTTRGLGLGLYLAWRQIALRWRIQRRKVISQ